MTMFPALVVPKVPDYFVNPKKIVSLLLGRETPLMFYVFRTNKPQFFVVFRQHKQRQQVEESQVFREAVTRHGLTYTYARYCKDTETLHEDDVGHKAESTSVPGEQEMATVGSHTTPPPTLRRGPGRGATSYGGQGWEMTGAASCVFSAHRPVRAGIGRGAGRSSHRLVDDQRLKGGELLGPPAWWRRESSMGRGRGRGSVQRGGGSRRQPPSLYSDFDEESVNYGCVSQDTRAPLVGARPRMKGDGGKAACLGEVSKLRMTKVFNEAGKTSGGHQDVRMHDSENLESRRKTLGGSERRDSRWLEDQVEALKKQLEEERKEQKLFLETLTCVVRGETPRAALGRAENNTAVELLKEALAQVKLPDGEMAGKKDLTKLKVQNGTAPGAGALALAIEEQNSKKTVSGGPGGWSVVGKRRRKQITSSMPSRASTLPSRRSSPGGRGVSPTSPELYTRRNVL